MADTDAKFVLPLKCAAQTYAWGRLGNDSEVAKLCQASDPDFKFDEKTPYAELWMGTHPKGPSVISNPRVQPNSLSEWINKHPESLGTKVRQTFGDHLPFLFKVLSVNKSLSIQAHPNKGHAEKLHATMPENYPDSNHKPEMAIALTEFEGLCGFRPISEIRAFVKAIPELQSVVGGDATSQLLNSSGDVDTEAYKPALKACFTALMTCQPEAVKESLAKLVQRLQAMDPSSDEFRSHEGSLLLRLNSQFPGDVGCFVIYFLNRMVLQPGEAMFLAANLPHAYLQGNCMECMACSDNVVRAGLTPKFKDVSTLCEMLNYTCKPASENRFPSIPDVTDPHTTIYNPPVPDFSVTRIILPDTVTEYTLPPVDSASIVLVIEGAAESEYATFKRGSVVFISANQSVQLRKSDASLLMFRAYCQL